MWHKLFIVFLIGFSVSSCGSIEKGSIDSLLLHSEGWTKKEIEGGLIHYSFNSQYMSVVESYQNINVLAIDPANKRYDIIFKNIVPFDSISAVAAKYDRSVFALNGTYYEKGEGKTGGYSTSFFRASGQLIDSVEVSPGSLFFWKHEGAFYKDQDKVGIIRGGNKEYKALQADNLISGSPLLVENFHASGEHFVRNITEDLQALHYENPDRHQGLRHPRTAVAITKEDYVLFVAVDGRAEKAQGMSAKELTSFLVYYFNPKDALNLDGGGSTTFWLKDAKSVKSPTGVVNYPSDNRNLDHAGQRKVSNAFIVIEK